jgi:hypothetical protein
MVYLWKDDICERKTMQRHSMKTNLYKPERGLEQAILPTSHRHNCEKVNLCCLSHPVYGVTLWQSWQANALFRGTSSIPSWLGREFFLVLPSIYIALQVVLDTKRLQLGAWEQGSRVGSDPGHACYPLEVTVPLGSLSFFLGCHSLWYEYA